MRRQTTRYIKYTLRLHNYLHLVPRLCGVIKRWLRLSYVYSFVSNNRSRMEFSVTNSLKVCYRGRRMVLTLSDLSELIHFRVILLDMKYDVGVIRRGGILWTETPHSCHHLYSVFRLFHISFSSSVGFVSNTYEPGYTLYWNISLLFRFINTEVRWETFPFKPESRDLCEIR